MRQIRALGKFDLVIDLHNSLRSRLILQSASRKKLLMYRKPYLKRFLMIHFKKKFFRAQESVALSYMNLLKELDITPRIISPVVHARASIKTDTVLSVFNRQKTKKIMAIALVPVGSPRRGH